jgi:hypothetical protein
VDDKILMLLKDRETTLDQLLELANKTNAVNRLIAAHPNADEELLDNLLEFWGENDERVDPEVIARALANPNISITKVILYGRDYPSIVLQNPALAAILKKKPKLYRDIPELLHSSECPEKLLSMASKEKGESYWPDILMNPSLPDHLIEFVKPDILFEKARQRLQVLANTFVSAEDKAYLELYQNSFRPFYVPRFLPFDRALHEHRISDQVLCGFPYTSMKWPWPKGENHRPMQPIMQLNLSNAGKLLGLPLGEGLIQVWGSVGSKWKTLIRNIPQHDLCEALNQDYPLDAPWLDVDTDGSPLFTDCITATFLLDEYRPFLISNCRVDWVDMGQMFYPSLYTRVFRPLEQDKFGMPDSDDCDDGIVESMDKKLKKLNLPTGRNRFGRRLFTLGGYGDDLGNTWGHISCSVNELIFFHSIDYGVKVTVALCCTFENQGKPEFEVYLNCEN